ITPSFVDKEKRAKNAAHYSSGLQAYSLTSMAFTPTTKAVAATLSDLDVMFSEVKDKGQIQMKTSLGDMHFELYCSQAPRACYNMIELAKKGYYNDTIFHRSIRDFMLQGGLHIRLTAGGDPTGTGSGGESIYGEPFKDEFTPQLKHLGRGVLSMANRGKDTNTSQLYASADRSQPSFITYAAAPHLNQKHTIFGKLIGGEKVLDACEGVGTSKADVPNPPIVIKEIKVITDPFKELGEKEDRIQSEKLRKIADREKRQRLTEASAGTTSASDQVGKYLKLGPVKEPRTSVQPDAGLDVDLLVPQSNASKKRKAGSGFGNFAGW
ncbi:RING-type E3 ubiquitin-protein ligase ppil2, partial [Kappamyces sp. JEL0680]